MDAWVFNPTNYCMEANFRTFMLLFVIQILKISFSIIHCSINEFTLICMVRKRGEDSSPTAFSLNPHTDSHMGYEILLCGVNRVAMKGIFI